MRWKVISITSVLPVLCSIGAAFDGDVGGEEAQKELQKLQVPGSWSQESGTEKRWQMSTSSRVESLTRELKWR